MSLTRRPSSVPASISERKISPLAMCGMAYSRATRFACVPLPAPWGPRKRMFKGTRPLLQETLVRAHHHLRLHLAHRFQRDADHDQHGGAAQRTRGRLREAAVTDEEARQDRDKGEVERAEPGQTRHNAVQILSRRRAWPNARHIAAVLAQVVGRVDNLRKYGGYVPGIRPGPPTAQYLDRVMTRLTWLGSLYLALVAVLPSLFIRYGGFSQATSRALGGTSVLIVVGVALDTMRQMESQMMARSYEGFLK